MANSFDDTRRPHQFAFDFVEDAVDELAAVLGGKLFGNIDRLIDADHGRDVLAVEHFVNGEPENVAVHCGHAMKLPVLRVLFDVLVDFVPMLDGAANQRFGKDPGGRLFGGGRREFDFFPPGGRSFIFREGGRALRVPKTG